MSEDAHPIDIRSIEAAASRIETYIRRTPLFHDSQNGLYLKLENHQETGSFKVRGAFNKILSLTSTELSRGLVTASAGNHGQGVALAGERAGAQVVVFASEHAVPAKVEAMRSLGADVRLIEGGYGEAEQTGLAFAQETGATWISPYNDPLVIAGQGTMGLEILQDLPLNQAPTWVVPIGGGGLAAGLGIALKADQRLLGRPSRAGLVGVQSIASPFFHSLYYNGSQAGVHEDESLADGLAGPVEEGSITIELVRANVSKVVLVSEAQIEEAIAFAWKTYHERIEGSAAAALAACLSGLVPERPAVVILSGGNIQPEIHGKIISRRV